jgi:SAM-dependent methyltransferase
MLLQVTAAHAAARHTLFENLSLGSRQFHSLFSGVLQPVRRFLGDLAPLRELGILEISVGEARAATPIIAFGDLFLKCDSPALELWDRVFPIHDDESLLLARWAPVKSGQRVLEIGAGAGAAALTMASRGADKVIATDINPRVGEYFAFNAELNGLTNRVEYVRSDVFSGLDCEKFDVIVCNPPFVPVPNELRYFLHSDGGCFGTSILERLATGWQSHARPAGRLYALALSLGSPREWRITNLFPDAYLSAIYGESHLDLDEFVEHFRWASGVNEWHESLKELEYDRIGYFGLVAGGNADSRLNCREPRLVAREIPVGSTPWSDCSWSMAARIRRYCPLPMQP